MRRDLDLLIRGGTVVDGTGTPGRVADVGVRGGRIVTGDLSGAAAGGELDATGLVVAPGFVDVHTHYDAQLFWDPAATPSPLHGVTTVIGGNCGFSLAPAGPEHADYLTRMMARVEGMPLEALRAGVDWQWGSFADWVDRHRGRVGVNAGFLVGHSTVRRAVLGDESGSREATSREIEQMQRLLHDALAAGALGFSTSQAPTHHDGAGRPVPSRAASRAEIVALAACCADHPGTSLELILPGCLGELSEAEARLMIDVSLAGRRPVNWNVLSVMASRPHSHEHQLAVSRRARTEGARVVALMLANPPGVRISFLTGAILHGLPGWEEVFALPVAERIATLSDPAARRRLAAAAADADAGVLGLLCRWANLEVVETFAPRNARHEGRRVGDIAAERGEDAFDVLCEIVTADALRTGLKPPPLAGNGDADWELRMQVSRDPDVVIGGSDAGAHLDMMCGATYTTSLLATAVRDKELVTVEEAVRLLADVPARLVGLRDRGRISDGWAADLVLFDPATVAPGPERTVHDLPAGAPRLFAGAAGVPHVLVGGVPVVADGKLTGATPGTVLRSGHDTDTAVLPVAR